MTMTESVTETIISTIAEPKLWAGKYKSPEDLEVAYKNVAGTFEENRELKSKIESYSKAPDDYVIPSDITLRDQELVEIKQMAKNAGLTQDHFEKMTRDMHGKIQGQLNAFQEAKQSLGEEKLNVLTDYVKRTYPESLHETVLNKLIKDKTAMSDALNHRDKLLNSQTPGISSGSTTIPQRYDGEAELQKIANEYRKRPTEATKAKYIDIARQVGEARELGRK
jgi:hypothetical protein